MSALRGPERESRSNPGKTRTPSFFGGWDDGVAVRMQAPEENDGKERMSRRPREMLWIEEAELSGRRIIIIVIWEVIISLGRFVTGSWVI